MKIRTSLATAVAAITIQAATSSSKTANEEGGRQKSPDFDDGKDDNKGSCGLYMATSSTSIFDDHKWGVYAGKDIDADSPIGFGELAIHIFQLMPNNVWQNPETGQMENDLDSNELANIVDWFEQYVWVPNSSGGQYEIDDGAKTVTAIPGTGVIGAYNPKMINADWNHSSAYHREAWNEFPVEAHPGRGAYTNYFNLELASTEVIWAGKEIFVEFGENWDDESGDEDKSYLTREDYERVDKTIEKMIQFFDKHDSKLDSASKQKIFEFLRDEVMEAAAGPDKANQIKGMLRDDPDELKQLLENGGSMASNAPGSYRSLEWLETNGLCMDHIKPGPSTIPYAGRGAIANRDIKIGTLVAPVPLIQISDFTILNMHSIDYIEETDEYEYFRESDEVNGIQLLVNYCWGHPESSMLFFPVGAVASYINHAPSQDKVNAKMVWSEHPGNHQELLEEELTSFNAMGKLLIEIVATKDIKEGEEVFIDYGNEWLDAWDRHVERWNKNKEDSWPMQALDFNQKHKTEPFRTVDEEPYPDNVMVKCFLMVKKPTADELQTDSEGRKIRFWSKADSGKTNIVSNNLFDCEIQSHEETSTGHSYEILWDSGKAVTLVKDVPHMAIVLLDRPEKGDQHIWNSFRHYISMGDIFPTPWKDMAEDDDDEDEEEYAYSEKGEL